jgi:hypothetical protein
LFPSLIINLPRPLSKQSEVKNALIDGGKNMKKELLVSGLIMVLLLISASSISGQKEAGVVPLKEAIMDRSNLGDLQFMWPAEEICSDFQIVGCETNGTRFFITGAYNGSDPNKVYILDFNGNLVGSFDQAGTTDWGWIDLAWDGSYFYAGHENSWLIDVFTEDGTVVDQIAAPVYWPVGMAYDPATDHLWTTDRFNDQKLYEIGKDGTVINVFPNTKLIYGLAWDNISAGGPYLWCSVFVDPDPQCTFYQIDPVTGTYTGVYFEPQDPPGGSVSNKACGLGFTTAWNTSAGVLFGIQQCDTPTPGDQIAGYFICNISVEDTTPPETTCNITGTNPVTITLTATDDMSGVNYTMYKLDTGAWTKYTAPIIVTAVGDHIVYFYSVDLAGNIETEKNASFTVEAPPITITIKGGLGVSATIKNTGTTALTNVDWTINLDGKLIIVGKTKGDTIASLAVGEEVKVKDFVIGFGKTNIVATAGDAEASASGMVILLFVIGVA